MVTKKDRAAILAAIQKDAAFNRALQRRYREPQGFADSRPWVEAAAIAAYLLKTGKAETLPLDDYQQQFAELSLAYVRSNPLPPHFWVGEALTDALWQFTTLNIKEIQPVTRPFAQQFVAHFPRGAIKSSASGFLREIHCLYDREGEAFDDGENQFVSPGARLLYTTSLVADASFSGVLALGEGSTRPRYIDQDGLKADGTINDPDTEPAFKQRVESLIYRLLLLGQERPELVEVGRDEAKFARMSRSQQKKRLAQSNLPFSPNWIGRSYPQPHEDTESETQEQHS